MYIYIYRLWIRKGIIYVGMTTQPSRRIKDHKNGKGSIHTIGQIIENHDILWKGPVKNKYHGMLIENSYARRMKEQYSCYKVLGGELTPSYKKRVIKKAFKK